MPGDKQKRFDDYRRDVERFLDIPNDFEKTGENLLDLIERKVIQHAFIVAHENQSEVARLLGMSRYTLRYRAEKHGLFKPRKKPRDPKIRKRR